MAVREASLEMLHASLGIDRAAAWLDEFAASADIPAEVTAKLQVVLDEIVSNLIRHAVPDAGAILLQVRRREHDVELAVTDHGPPFDPTRFEPVPLEVRVAERQVGGAGLLFVRALIDEIEFARRDGRNHLVLRKRLPTSTTEE